MACRECEHVQVLANRPSCVKQDLMGEAGGIGQTQGMPPSWEAGAKITCTERKPGLRLNGADNLRSLFPLSSRIHMA